MKLLLTKLKTGRKDRADAVKHQLEAAGLVKVGDGKHLAVHTKYTLSTVSTWYWRTRGDLVGWCGIIGGKLLHVYLI